MLSNKTSNFAIYFPLIFTLALLLTTASSDSIVANCNSLSDERGRGGGVAVRVPSGTGPAFVHVILRLHELGVGQSHALPPLLVGRRHDGPVRTHHLHAHMHTSRQAHKHTGIHHNTTQQGHMDKRYEIWQGNGMTPQHHIIYPSHPACPSTMHICMSCHVMSCNASPLFWDYLGRRHRCIFPPDPSLARSSTRCRSTWAQELPAKDLQQDTIQTMPCHTMRDNKRV